MKSSYMQKPNWNEGRKIEIERLKNLIIKEVDEYCKKVVTVLSKKYKDESYAMKEIKRLSSAIDKDIQKYSDKVVKLEMEVSLNASRNYDKH